jgi:adenosine deaminase
MIPTIAGPAARALGSLSSDQIEFIRSLPKAELHAHLNGSIPLTILQDLAQSYSPPAADIQNGLSNDAVLAGLDKLRNGVTLEAIGDFFGLFPAIYALTSTPEAIARATRGVLDAFFQVGDGGGEPECTYLELRTTPRSTEAMSREIYLRTVLSVTSSYAKDLPPLPESISHEPARSRIAVIASLDRRMSLEVMEEIVDLAIRLKDEGLGLVGVDLCGDPLKGNVEEWRHIFEKVRAGGLGVTLHIAEVRRMIFPLII